LWIGYTHTYLQLVSFAKISRLTSTEPDLAQNRFLSGVSVMLTTGTVVGTDTMDEDTRSESFIAQVQVTPIGNGERDEEDEGEGRKEVDICAHKCIKSVAAVVSSIVSIIVVIIHRIRLAAV
jgi:hypothetical protein